MAHGAAAGGAEALDELDRKILAAVNERGVIEDSVALAAEFGVDPNVLGGRARSLAADSLIEITTFERPSTTITPEGRAVLAEGTPEYRVYIALGDGPKTQKELAVVVGEGAGKFGVSTGMGKGWFANEKGVLSRKMEVHADVLRDVLGQVERGGEGEAGAVAEIKKRKWILQSVLKILKITKGPKFALARGTKVADVTADLIKQLKTGEVKMSGLTVKPYNLCARGIPPPGGHLHPLLKMRAEYRKIFLEMGFQEMQTNRYVESSFWNFDTLFQAQAHPCRDAHDTFFLKEPAHTLVLPDDFVEKTKEIHEKGGYGSKGHQYTWLLQEAKKNILRTHTTAISTQVLYKLAQAPTFTPSKFFSIDRVFRNETLDATHLAEFHQVEGIIIDRNLGLGHLIGVLRSFFQRLGLNKLRFKPAYNPYTEPSMEIFGWMESLNKWVEIGNSGVFRPEMLRPMGFPEDVSAIAWGLSVERPTMMLYGLNNIRDLFGHKIDLSIVRTNPICRLPDHGFVQINEGETIASQGV